VLFPDAGTLQSEACKNIQCDTVIQMHDENSSVILLVWRREVAG